MTWSSGELASFVAAALEAKRDPEKAVRMAAYMKTEMPFYGVQKAGRTEVFRELEKRFPVRSRDGYRRAVTTLWEAPHREEKYLAISVANAYPAYVTYEALPLFRRLIVEGAWWDFVDDVASRSVGHILRSERPLMRPELDQWIDDPDMWIRRSALIAHLRHKAETDQSQLFDHCLRRSWEKEFFIRKAIGWALREYAKTDPDAVTQFLLAHRDDLSGLSFREASKHLDV